MCGIAGVWTRKKRAEPLWIIKITDAIKHRGPDDEGFLAINTRTKKIFPLSGKDSQVPGTNIADFREDADLFFGHRRLSILDLSPLGHQPMCDADQGLWIVHNGEIYNYLPLREELKARGYRFRTQTDTEVLLAAYKEWGEGCLDKLDGMWAFVIYDKLRNRLFGSRDRFGVKPFYYFFDGSTFAFASEIKALLKLDCVPESMNEKAAFDYLVFGRVEAEEDGLFNKIKELLPSHSFHLDCGSGRLAIRKYYSLSINTAVERFDSRKADQHVQRTRALVEESVFSHLQSDVPVGSCLSGGLDSSTIVCVINSFLDRAHPSQIGDRQKVYTVSYQDARVDESRWAEFIVNKTRTKWHRVFPRPEDISSAIEDIVYSQDIPFLSTSVISQHFLMKKVRETGTKVLLDGQGGDELFAGYRGHFYPAFIEKARHLALRDIFRELRALDHSSIGLRYLLYGLLKIYLPKMAPMRILRAYARQSRIEVRYLNNDFWGAYEKNLSEYRERHVGSLNQTLSEAITGPDFKYLLRYEDRNAMRFSIEARTPFADHKALIEEAFQIPGVYKIYNGWSKYLLRKAAEGILPAEVQWRRDKLGFPTPEVPWLRRLKGKIMDYLAGDVGRYINAELIRKELDNIIEARKGQNNPCFWRLIIFAVWKRVFNL